jgi:hypothetical protein
MNENFVEDGERRIRNGATYRTEVDALRKSVRERFASRIAAAGFIAGLRLQVTMWWELRRERHRLGPSPESLYLNRA